MSKCYRRFFNAVIIAVLVFAFNIVAFAQGTTTITVSKSSPAVGDSVTVSVSGTESGTITVKYTSSMLNYISCSASSASAEGNSVSFSGKSADIVFKASSAGTASIIVSSSANSGSSTTLSIGGSGSSASTQTTTETTETANNEEETVVKEDDAEVDVETETDETENTETDGTQPAAVTSASGVVGSLNSDGGFDINGTAYVVSERYSDSEMPSGFSKTTVKIGSSTYSEPSNGTITLLYLKPADNTSGSGVFYLYDAEAGTVSEFLMLGSKDSYVIISDNGSGPSSAFTATSLEVTGGTATAYTTGDSAFYYVYGTNQDGATGWYVYDSEYKTVSRFDESALSSSSADTTSGDGESGAAGSDSGVYIQKLGLYRKIIMGLIILCVVLLFIIINKAIRGRGDDDDFDGDVFAKAPIKPAKKTPRSIVFSLRDRDADDDDDEEEEEYEEDDEYDDEIEDEDDTSRSRYESESYEARRASSLNMMDLNDL